MFELSIIQVLVIILNIEAVTNIISKSELFKPLRGGLFNLYNSRGIKFAGFVHDLIDCPYCTSVWVSLFYLLCVYISASSPLFLSIFVFFCLIIVFHRLSNILHHIIDRIDVNRL
jgi:hypothetical protein